MPKILTEAEAQHQIGLAFMVAQGAGRAVDDEYSRQLFALAWAMGRRIGRKEGDVDG